MASILITLACIGGYWLAEMSLYSIIPIGLLSILASIKYSGGRHVLASIALGELTAFLFLGVVVTNLAYVVQTKTISLDIVMASILFGLLIAMMILTNNLRDIEKDRSFRITVPMLLGKRRTVYLLAGLAIILYSLVFVLILQGIFPVHTLLVFFAIPFALKLIYHFRGSATILENQQSMKWAAFHHTVFGILFTILVWL